MLSLNENGKEVKQWNELLSVLNGFKSNFCDVDCLLWKGSNNGMHSLRLAPPKVEIFLWLVMQKRISVRVELIKRCFHGRMHELSTLTVQRGHSYRLY
ncbi:hypothetical protein GQ457_05G028380 [Hibiscus cannabinus]